MAELPTTSPRQLLTPREVADLLQVRPSFVYRLAREDRIPHVRLGERYVRFDATALERWIAERSER
jgi:excisionase family DNA binding protein